MSRFFMCQVSGYVGVFRTCQGVSCYFDMSALNTCVPTNIEPIFLTLDTSHFETSALNTGSRGSGSVWLSRLVDSQHTQLRTKRALPPILSAQRCKKRIQNM